MRTSNVHALVRELVEFQIEKEGKSEIEAKLYALDYIESFLAQLYDTEQVVRQSVDSRLRYQRQFLENRLARRDRNTS